MIYYIFSTQIFTLFLSTQYITSLHLNDKVVDYVGGHKNELKVYEQNKKKSLIFKALVDKIDTNFNIFLENTHYHFNLKTHSSLLTKEVRLEKAQECQSFKLLKKTKSYKLFECPKSLYLKVSSKVQVNERLIDASLYLSKGPALYIDSELVYFEGRVL